MQPLQAEISLLVNSMLQRLPKHKYQTLSWLLSSSVRQPPAQRYQLQSLIIVAKKAATKSRASKPAKFGAKMALNFGFGALKGVIGVDLSGVADGIDLGIAGVSLAGIANSGNGGGNSADIGGGGASGAINTPALPQAPPMQMDWTPNQMAAVDPIQ